MNPLSNNDIESELSYAYLHAVASRAGMGCRLATRHEDNRGVDATLTAWGPFPKGGYLEEIDIKIQLKATTTGTKVKNGFIPYFFDGIQQYNDLRRKTMATHRILVVLFLPKDDKNWLKISVNQLILRNCAYWLSLRGAAESQNDSGQTVYIPESQVLDTNNLKAICTRLSRKEEINYTQP